MNEMPDLILFDMDGTLTESKQPLTERMAHLVSKLLERTHVGIISGGALEQFLKQAVERLPAGANLANLFLLPTSGAAFYEWDGSGWSKRYEERLTERELATIEEAMREAAAETGIIDMKSPAYGERIEYRGGQVSMSALGQKAPIALKKEWDPDKRKRHALRDLIAKKLPGYAVGMGGSTTIDVTKKGVDKAYGLRQVCNRLGIKESDALYVGDELVGGGNDEAVFTTDSQTKAVSAPVETEAFISSLLGS